ncbi:MAG TPA: chemotaxis protein CheW [Pyrinomonadaceae bacterium]|nr:chemotaxis protein CheW [Pyrinomonadaceae bacterium]
MNEAQASTTRAVRVLTVGQRRFGIFDEEIDTIVGWRPPTPLPNAPAGILGVVCVRSRMLTLIAVNLLLDTGADAGKKIVALRGEEQIGLAVSEARELIDVDSSELQLPDGKEALTLGVITADGQPLSILNSKNLFATAMRGRERRKRQF